MADSVPDFLRHLMDAAGLKQASLARAIKVSQSTISKWLRGEHSPNLMQWNKVLGYARSHVKTRHLLAEAPELSLDAMVDPYGPKAKAHARTIVEAYIKTLEP